MARMSIDDQVLRDPRVIRLSKLMSWSRRETLGCLLDVWALCYDRAWHVLPIDDVDTAAQSEGFHTHLITVGLGRMAPLDVDADADADIDLAVGDGVGDGVTYGIHIAGAAKRVAYLQTHDDKSAKGGKRSGEVRRQSVSVFTNDEAKSKRAANPLPTLIASASVDPGVDPSVGDTRGKRANVRWQEVIEAFTESYATANGAPPSWTTNAARRALKPLRAIVREHGADEVIRRIRLVHATPPNWPPGPWDVTMFVQHFDRLVTREASPRNTRSNPAQEQLDRQLDRVAQLERMAQTNHRYDGQRATCALCSHASDHPLHEHPSDPHDVDDEAPPWE